MTGKPQADFNLEIMAGEAFGNGAHESTRGALAAMDLLKQEDHNFLHILDVGCGSGILGLAACRIWDGATLLAADIEPKSVEATLQNAIHNGLAGRVSAVRSDGFYHERIRRNAPYDLILCNIIPEILISMAGNAAGNLRKGGFLVLSGILAWLCEPVEEAYKTADLVLRRRLAVGDWRTLILQKH